MQLAILVIHAAQRKKNHDDERCIRCYGFKVCNIKKNQDTRCPNFRTCNT